MEEAVADYFDCEVGELTKEMLESLVAVETRYEYLPWEGYGTFSMPILPRGKLGIENSYRAIRSSCY